MKDPLFGDIEYEFGWVGNCSWPIFGQIATTRLVISCDEGDEIESIQRDAFATFDAHKQALCKLAEDAILKYYREIAPEYRERIGGQLAMSRLPEIGSTDELALVVTATELIVQQSFAIPAERVIGLLFDCAWDTSLGLAVKLVDEQVSQVGSQDIVL